MTEKGKNSSAKGLGIEGRNLRRRNKFVIGNKTRNIRETVLIRDVT